MQHVGSQILGRILTLAVTTLLAGLIVVHGPGTATAQDDGHGHGAAPRTISVAPRAEARIGNQELVITYVDETVVLFLHRYVDGSPTSGADLEVVIDFLPETLTEITAGIYRSGPVLLAGGRNEIELNYAIDGQTGSETIPLFVPTTGGHTTSAQAGPTSGVGGLPGSVLAAIAILLFLAVNFVFARRA